MKSLFALIALAGALSVIACSNNSNSSNSGTTTASTPQPCNNQAQVGYPSTGCLNSSYYPAGTTYNWPNGAWYWPSNYQSSYGSCGCNSGYFPVQGPFGTACAPSTYFTNYNTRIIYMSSGSWPGYWNYGQNSGWINRPQATYNSSASCAGSTAQGCDVRLNNCTSGRCQPVGGGSTIGLCVY